jgi:uncharacterized protein (TIGR02246 family)
MRKALLALGLLAACLLFVTDLSGTGQQPTTASPQPAAGAQPAAGDEQAIRQAVAAYAEAFNKGDQAAIAAAWAPDAEYISEDGTTTRGRDAITALFRQIFTDRKGTKMDLKVSSVRVLKGGDVALQDGTSSITDPDGSTTSGRYSAVWVKSDGKWMVRSARDLPGETGDTTAAAAALKPLEWLVGDWESEKGNLSVSTRWALDRAFLMQEFKVKEADGGELKIVQLVGYDPLTDQIKSWTFDSRGGYGEGLWTRDGNSWVIETAGVLPEGLTGTARNTIRFSDDQSFVFQTREREIDGQPIPDGEVKLVRKSAAK